MLAKQQRYPLRHDKEFFSVARRFHSPSLTLFVKKSSVLSLPSQGAVIVPKKTYKLAVQRNIAKRQMTALLSPFLRQHPGFVIVILIKTHLSFTELVKLPTEWEKILSRL